MAQGALLRITLYDRTTDEPQVELVRGHVAWKWLKFALRLARVATDDAEVLDKLTYLAAGVFGVTFERMRKGAEPAEIATVASALIARARLYTRDDKPATEGADDLAWITDLEISLVRAYGWSLQDIDETDIETLLPYIRRLNERPGEQEQLTTCDKVPWL